MMANLPAGGAGGPPPTVLTAQPGQPGGPDVCGPQAEAEAVGDEGSGAESSAGE